MLNDLTDEQLYEWTLYYHAHPFTIDLFNMMFAQLDSIIANANRDEKKRSTPFDMDEFILKFDPEEIKQNQEKRERKQSSFAQLYAKVEAKKKQNAKQNKKLNR